MKQGVTGSGSTSNSDYPETAAANAELEAKLTGGGQHGAGGSGSAMPNEAQVNIGNRHACLQARSGMLPVAQSKDHRRLKLENFFCRSTTARQRRFREATKMGDK